VIGEPACQIDLMQADDRGDAVLAADPMKVLEYPDGSGRVEARDRLIGEHDLRLLGHGARDADALLLPAGKLVGAVECPVGKTDPVERLQREQAVCARQRKNRPRDAVRSEPSRQHVVERRKPADQMMLLEHHPGPSPMRPQLGAAGEDRSAPLNANLTRGRAHEPIEAAQQRRFSCARSAEKNDELPLLEDGARRPQRHDAVGVCNCHVLER
jgi:hypothetical protein